MCGRFSLLAHQKLLRERFDIKNFDYTPEPQYNISPEQKIAVIIPAEDSSRTMRAMRWGLIPFWSDNPNDPDYSPINVRAETIAEKRMYKRAFKNRRCLVPASGFYEWKGESGSKVPFYFHLSDNDLFAFPGIYEVAESDDKQSKIFSVTFATTEANEIVGRVHPRMPVILAREEESKWLSVDSDEEELLEILDPYPYEEMEMYEVSTFVNNPMNEGSQAIKPVKDN